VDPADKEKFDKMVDEIHTKVWGGCAQGMNSTAVYASAT
jgi:hypothetical protein